MKRPVRRKKKKVIYFFEKNRKFFTFRMRLWRYLIILSILIIAIRFRKKKMQSRIIKDESTPIYSLYRFNKYITVKDFKMLYQFIYSKKICCITYMIDGELIKQMIFKKGYVLEYENTIFEVTDSDITRTARSMTFNIKPIGTKITFSINSRIKISTRNRNYTNIVAICRIYDI